MKFQDFKTIVINKLEKLEIEMSVQVLKSSFKLFWVLEFEIFMLKGLLILLNLKDYWNESHRVE